MTQLHFVGFLFADKIEDQGFGEQNEDEVLTFGCFSISLSSSLLLQGSTVETPMHNNTQPHRPFPRRPPRSSRDFLFATGSGSKNMERQRLKINRSRQTVKYGSIVTQSE